MEQNHKNWLGNGNIRLTWNLIEGGQWKCEQTGETRTTEEWRQLYGPTFGASWRIAKSVKDESPGWGSERFVFHKMEDGSWKCNETGEIQTQEEVDERSAELAKFSNPQ